MKKTLITLAALAVSAAAYANTVSPDLQDDLASGFADMTANVTTIDKRPGSSIYGVESTEAATASYTWIAVISQDSVEDVLGNWQDRSRIYATDGSKVEAALGIEIFHNDSNQLAVQFIEHDTDTHYNPGVGTVTNLTISNPTPDSIILSGVETDVGKKYALSMSYNDATKIYTFTALTADNTVGTVTFQKASTWDVGNYKGADITNDAVNAVEHFMWFDRALTSNEIAAIATHVIPEPATATLSLLALAGLAARRRRK